MIALPILYVLSIGPVAHMFGRSSHINPQINSAVNAFYKPLELLHEHTPLQAPLDAYVRWWMELGGGHLGKP
ncbi:MAG: hypothetical protein ACO1QR_13975 [Chthoniobacteraceae bacterium]